MRFTAVTFAAFAAVARAQHMDHDGHAHDHGGGGVSKVVNTHYVHWSPAESPFSDVMADIGDKIVFELDSSSNLIGFRTKSDYDACKVKKGVQMAAAGSGVFETDLRKPGSLFLSSTNGCKAGQKLKLTIQAPPECGAHSHDSRCAGAHSPHEDEEHGMPSGPDCSGHSHDPRCPGAHSAAEHSSHAEPKATSRVVPSTPRACGVPAVTAPSSPRAGAAAVKKSNKLTLVWAAPQSEFDATRGDSFTISYNGNSIETQDTTVDIEGLQASTKYTFEIVARNARGTSKALKMKAKTKK